MTPKATVELDRTSPLPLYAQIKRRLYTLINSGACADGRFLTDQELCAMFGVSRFTIRQSVQELVHEGLLVRMQGQGTFVNKRKTDEVFGPKMDFVNQWQRAGRPLEFSLKRFELAPCPRDMAQLLGLDEGREVLCLERQRRNSEQVVSYDFRYFHPDYASAVDRDEAASESLLVLLARSVKLSRADNGVEASLAGDAVGSLLEIDPEKPVLVREFVYFSDGDVPVLAGRSFYPGDAVRQRFTVALDGPTSSRADES